MTLDQRVRSTGLSTPPTEEDFRSAEGTPIVVTEAGEAWVLLSDGRIVKIGEGMSMEQEINTTGMYRGKSAHMQTIFGARTQGWSSTTLFEDIADYLDTSQPYLNQVNPATQHYVVSTSVQDLTAGSGVDRLRLTYLDLNGLEQITTISLNGTTPVALPMMSYCQYMETYHSTQPRRFPAGVISVVTAAAPATVANTIDRVTDSSNRSLSLRYKVPLDSEVYLISGRAFAINAAMDARAVSTEFESGAISTCFELDTRAFLAQNTGSSPDHHYQRLGPGIEFKVIARTTAAPAGNKIDVSTTMAVVKL